ncbi:LAGLIDADG homing endonuclease (mitochondrion) [Rhizoctonia solani AG-1 IB]|uniref:LAGLIDADG homing endonuclease n=1 Tax=Thanatephorus cucumeris (strain AG1-IB / isolate 7/3/14) TaxID=1108050 RepID=M5BMJ6_THACB|nr:LAGLIDADG homing endonuclease [Rhizoctonia solani AG-1 IB]
MFQLPFMKKNNITRAERLQFSLPQNLQDILVGLILGDLCVRKPKTCVNVKLQFCQGLLHKEYLMHLYDLFKIKKSAIFCLQFARGSQRSWAARSPILILRINMRGMGHGSSRKLSVIAVPLLK